MTLSAQGASGDEAATSIASVQRGGRFLSSLALVLTIAFALRFGWAAFATGTIDFEGAEYARLAKNLASGRGYVGIDTPGKNLMFPPLYPFLIAAATVATHNEEQAARLISVVMGTALPLVIYAVGRRLYNHKIALIAAALIAVHPLLVGFSAMGYCETTYITLLFTAVYWTIRAFRSATSPSFAMAGAFFGLAYLTRAEAVIFPLAAFALALLYVWQRGTSFPFRIAQRSLLLPGMFLVLAVPYLLWLHSQTGQWRIEGKSPLNYVTAREIVNGVAFSDAHYGVDADLKERGVWIQSNLTTIQATHFRPFEFARYLQARSKDIIAYTKDTLTGSAIFGSPPLFAFAVLGLFRKRWDHLHAVSQLLLWVIMVVSSAALFGIYYLSPRFFLVLAPIFVLWASNGIVAFTMWARSAVRLFCSSPVKIRWIAGGLATLLAGMIPVVSAPRAAILSEIYTFNRASLPLKGAGEWLNAYAPGQKTVMDASTTVSFYASADWAPFPYCSSDVAMRYLDKRGVNFIVIRDRALNSRPYLKTWIETGIPSSRARLIYNAKAPELGRILIYEWEPVSQERASND